MDTFTAIADPTRRSLLAQLHQRGAQSLTELAEPFAMSRQAVTKHLDVLRRAELIAVEQKGRERLHHLNERPLQAIDDWLEPYSAAWDRRLDRLKQHLEENPE